MYNVKVKIERDMSLFSNKIEVCDIVIVRKIKGERESKVEVEVEVIESYIIVERCRVRRLGV